MDARTFLATRRPPPPEALARWLRDVPLEGTPLDGVTHQALSSLDRARGRPGRVRESAFHLLGADALLTYACEAALEESVPAEALGRLLLQVVENG